MSLGIYLLAQLKMAITMSKMQQERHEELDSTFPSSVVQKWEEMVSNWNADPMAPNPYVEPVIGESLSPGYVPVHFQFVFEVHL